MGPLRGGRVSVFRREVLDDDQESHQSNPVIGKDPSASALASRTASQSARFCRIGTAASTVIGGVAHGLLAFFDGLGRGARHVIQVETSCPWEQKAVPRALVEPAHRDPEQVRCLRNGQPDQPRGLGSPCAPERAVEVAWCLPSC